MILILRKIKKNLIDDPFSFYNMKKCACIDCLAEQLVLSEGEGKQKGPSTSLRQTKWLLNS